MTVGPEPGNAALPGGEATTGPPKAADNERLAAALRENLRRRKAQDAAGAPPQAERPGKLPD